MPVILLNYFTNNFFPLICNSDAVMLESGLPQHLVLLADWFSKMNLCMNLGKTKIISFQTLLPGHEDLKVLFLGREIKKKRKRCFMELP